MLNRLLIVIAALFFVLPAAAVETKPFQITFGTSRPDTADFVVETPNSDLLVAGSGDDTASHEVCDGRSLPMLARFSRDGRLIWTRLYEQFPRSEIELVVEDFRGIYILVSYVNYCDEKNQRNRKHTLELWRADLHGQIIDRVLQREGLAVMRRGRGEFDPLGTDVLLGGSEKSAAYRATSDKQKRQLSRLNYFGKLVEQPIRQVYDYVNTAVLLSSGDYAYITRDSLHGYPSAVSVFNSEGDIQWELPPSDGWEQRMIRAAGAELLEVSEAENKDEHIWQFRKINADGEVIWWQIFPRPDPIGYIVDIEVGQKGDFFVAGELDMQASVARLSPTGNVLWRKRFMSSKAISWASYVLQLSDGSIAVVGGTRSSRYGTDDDAFLLISDPNGEALDQYASCITDTSQTRHLEETLRRDYGLSIDSPTQRGKTGSQLYAQPPKLGQILLPPDSCGDPSEADYLSFLYGLYEALDRRMLTYDARDIAGVVVDVRPSKSLAPEGLKEQGTVRRVYPPTLLVDHRYPEDAAYYLSENIFPYLRDLKSAMVFLRHEIGVRITSASGTTAHQYHKPSIRDSTKIATTLTEQYALLTRYQQRELKVLAAALKGYGGISIRVTSKRNTLERSGYGVAVSADRAADIFPYILQDVPILQQRSDGLEREVRSDWGLAVKATDPQLDVVDYVAILISIKDSARSLDRDRKAHLRTLNITISVGNSWAAPVSFKSPENGEIYLRPDGVADLFTFIFDHETELQR